MKKVEIYNEERTQIESLKDYEQLNDHQMIDIFVVYPFKEIGTRYVASMYKGDIEGIKFTANGGIHNINGIFFRNDSIAVLG